MVVRQVLKPHTAESPSALAESSDNLQNFRHIHNKLKSQGTKTCLLRDWLPVIAVVILAIVIRLHRTSTENFYLLAGSDGPYFALQVKYLLLHHRLAFADMPLLFVWGAVFAKILYIFHAGPLEHCILLSVKLTDAFLPPLTAIPVFLIAIELNKPCTKLRWATNTVIAFATLSFTPLVHFSYQLQKNGAAVPLVFLYIYYVIRILKRQNRGDLIKAGTVLLVCALTHFGSCGLLLFASFLILISWLTIVASQKGFYPVKILLFVGSGFVLIFVLIAILDEQRFARILHAPFKLLEAPALLFSLSGHNLVFFQPLISILFLTILLAIQGIIILIRNRMVIAKYKFVIGLSLAFCTLFLSNPFLGLEWAKRLFMLAYIPLSILYLVIFSFLTTRWLRACSMLAFLFLVVIAFASALFEKPFISLGSKAFEEFKQLNSKVNLKNNDAVVGRQDLRLLANWCFESKGVADYLLTKNEFNKYHSIYWVRQVKDNGLAFHEAPKTIPANYDKQFAGEYFEVYKITSAENLPVRPEKIFKGTRGTIVGSFANRLLVKEYNSNFIRTVYVKEDKNYAANFPVGTEVEVNGELTPFSLAIRADTVKKVNSFK